MRESETPDMKHTFCFLFCLSFFSLLAGCSQPAPTATQISADVEKIAQTVIEHLGRGDYSAAFSYFDSNLKVAFPEAQLKNTWEQIVSQVGLFQKSTGVRTTLQQGRRIVIITCQFEKDLLDIQLGFNDQSQVVGLSFAQAEAAAPAMPTYTPPDYVIARSFSEVEVTIGSGEWALPGTLTVPFCGNEPVPAFVFVHGSGPNDRNETIGPNQPFHDLAWGLASHCIAVLRYDKRTFTHASKFTPKVLAAFTTQQEVVEDALLAVKLLRQTSGIDAQKIYLMGHSEGGMLLPRIAQQNPDLAGLVFMAAPSRPLEELILDQLTYLSELDGNVTDEEATNLEAVKSDIARIHSPDLSPNDSLLGIGAAYWLDLRGYRPAESAKALSLPMYILQGGRDYQILADKDFIGWKTVLQDKENIIFKLYPELNHLFIPGVGTSIPQEYQVEGHVSQEVIDDIAEWLGQAEAREEN
jgi:pimeloyl-ACP methyl ester carboxylesterase